MGANYANRKHHSHWCELIALHLSVAGLDASTPERRNYTRHRLSEAFAPENDGPPRPDVELDGWHIRASASLSSERIGPALDGAESAAALTGRGDRPVVIMHRRSHGPDGALVTMSMATFRKVAAELAGVDV